MIVNTLFLCQVIIKLELFNLHILWMPPVSVLVLGVQDLCLLFPKTLHIRWNVCLICYIEDADKIIIIIFNLDGLCKKLFFPKLLSHFSISPHLSFVFQLFDDFLF